MGLESLQMHAKAPDVLNAVIEITPDTGSVKYEFDKDSGMLMVDRFMNTTMRYPCSYGFVPQTLAEDGDPLDVLILSPDNILPGTLIEVRPVGVLLMEDEAGLDSKVLTVPTKKVCPMMAHINDLSDVPQMMRDQIKHFFEHYKDLEPNKWVKVTGWAELDKAHEIIQESIARVA